MSKPSAYKVVLIPLAAASLALLTLLAQGTASTGKPASAASLQEATATVELYAGLTLVKEGVPVSGAGLGDGGIILPGGVISYTIVYTNVGALDITGVRVEDDYDEILVSDVSSISDDGDDDGDTIVWELGTLEAGGGGSVSYRTTLIDAFPLGSVSVGNTATIDGDNAAPYSVSRSLVLDQPDLTVEAVPELVEGKDEEAVVRPGDTIQYTIRYENTGGAAANDVRLIDDYNEEFIGLVEGISGGGMDLDGVITWDLGTFEAGQSGSVSYRATLKERFPPGSTNVENRISIESFRVRPVPATTSVVVKNPHLTLVKTKPELAQDVDEDGRMGLGDAIRYTIVYKNVGEVEATQVTLEDDYDHVHLTSVRVLVEDEEGEPRIPWVDDGYSIAWDVGTIAPDMEGSVTYQGTLHSLPIGSTVVGNKATLSSAELEPLSKVVTITVKVPTPTPTPTPTAAPAAEGPQTGIFASNPWALIVLLLIVGFGGMVGLIVAGMKIELAAGGGNQRVLVILEGITVHMIVCAVIVLAVGGGIKPEAAAPILSAVAGYVFGRARGRTEEQSGGS
jgi:hypothetical protein